ncbi:uncharacterized protein LOC110229856 [Arabidopsis lyrata subsp. lyrata]|uniref:uncharacterized protein LOC110229856 n=1 Tax=Arabidopsis lyrata subsp. lyrata TaxID=81972 RepID=UPI000A29C202|nr:uncharacterized protein LOC110229856 [Arabidopsis lyrata subsp. lyrata]|eukprot:XP_020886568.1 uncharacterized protein LOC110229856 [Arabidopsis lyrata subsp. lyrata]
MRSIFDGGHIGVSDSYPHVHNIVGLYPKGSPSRNSQGPKTSLGPGGGLEIVFNQQ